MIDPVAFTLGPHPIYWYGILVAAGFGAAFVHWTALAKRRGRTQAFASDIVFWLMIGGIVGARAAYVAANWNEFAADPTSIVRIDRGGLIFYGGAIGGAAAIVLLALRRREPLLPLADFVATGAPLGHAFGRVGCFLNACCYGIPTSAWIGAIAGGRHPTQLYEAAGNLVLYGALTLMHRSNRRAGRVFAAYLALYALLRFAIEFLRGDEHQRMAGLSLAQWISLAWGAVGLAVWRAARAAGSGDADAAARRSR